MAPLQHLPAAVIENRVISPSMLALRGVTETARGSAAGDGRNRNGAGGRSTREIINSLMLRNWAPERQALLRLIK